MVYASGVWQLNNKSRQTATGRRARCAVAASCCEVFDVFSAVNAIGTNRLKALKLVKTEKVKTRNET
jgi:hypothetical protein